MRIGILGTGNVGQRLAAGFAQLGHDVCIGSRAGDKGVATSRGTFAEAAAHGELVINCVGGQHTLAALEGCELDGKVLIDAANPLDFSQGFPPSLTVCNTDSLAEQIQRAHPGARVVKCFNTVSNTIMVQPIPDTTLLICGDDADAKAAVRELVGAFGWDDVLDLGPLSAARGQEAWLLLWTRMYAAIGHADFNLKVVR